MKPVEIEFLIQDHTAAGARRVASSVDRETVKLVGKIDSVQKKIEELRAANSKSLDQSENIAQIKKLEAEMDRLQQKLAKASVAGKNVLPKPADIDATVRQYNGLNMSIQQLARELPTLAMGPQMFFMAISNNLPIFTDELARARKEYNLLVADGKKGIPIWKQMLSSIVSWQTALAVGIALLVTYGDDIATWAKNLFTGSKALDSSAVAAERFHATMVEGARNAQSEVVKLNLLYRAATNTARSMDERREAAEKLQETYPDYFEKLTTEQILLGQANDQYKTLVKSIYDYAKAQAAFKNLVSVAEQEQTLQGASSYDKYLEKYERLRQARETEKAAQEEYDATPWYERGNASSVYKALSNAKSWRRLYETEADAAAKTLIEELSKIPGGDDVVNMIKEQFSGDVGALVDALNAQRERLESIAESSQINDDPSKQKSIKPKKIVTDTQGRDLFLKAQRDLEDQQLAIMQEGYEKRRAEAKVQFERQLHDIRENRAKLLAIDREEGGTNQTRINSLFNSQILAATQNYRNTLQSIEQEEQAEAEKAYDDLLQKYETYLQKRDRLAREYDRDINTLVISPENQAEAIKAKEKALQDLDISFAEQFPQFERWAESITTLSINKLRDLLSEAIVELERLEGLETVNPEAEAKARAAVTTLQNAITSFTDKKDAPEDDDFDRWSELSEVLSRTGRDFAKLGGQVDDTLGEILGAAGEIASATVSAISGVQRLVEDSTSAIEGTTEAATASMTKLERASVILTVISAAFSVFNALAGVFKNTESSLERNLRLAKEFNEELRVMNERARINKDENSIFGDAIYNNFRENLSVLRQALQDFEKDKEALLWRGNEMYVGTAQSMVPWEDPSASIANMQVQTQHSTWFRSSKYASLKDLLPELFGEDGQVNMDALRAFADESNEIFNKLSKNNQNLIKSFLADWDTFEQAMEATRDYLSSIFGDIGNSILDAMMAVADGTKTAEESMEAMMESLSQTVRNFAKDMLYSMTIAPLLKKAQSEIEKIYATTEGSDEDKFNAMLETFGVLLGELQGAQGDFNAYWAAMKAKAAEMGFDIGDAQATTQKGKEGVLHTVSQDGFTRMEGILTSLQMHAASQDMKLDNITDLMISQLEAMNAIAINTETLPLTYAILKKFEQNGIMIQ